MLTDKGIRDEILDVLTRLAPEVEPQAISGDTLLRSQVDLDSMDWLNFLVGVHRRLHIAIPEKDYASLRTLNDIVAYVQIHAPNG
ncbi:acyl carrier protein [Mycolicibacterium porcinum]|uniref:acyl carrier protein n=1 Tax=Mycolicibacterium porcinum TaxID=39693 RepID=UPI001190C498|nr:phosphopantetheine-binding protein [Mycolicibacterium porcinum]TVX97475.1 acyl carrier protein [Mycolicibacterium porcinum]